jgi:TPR repeat protein
MTWWKNAAELGSAEGAFDVGIMYLDAEGVPVDEKKAVEWLRRSADSGSVPAAERLAHGAPAKGRLAAGARRDALAQDSCRCRRRLIHVRPWHGSVSGRRYTNRLCGSLQVVRPCGGAWTNDGRKGMLPRMTAKQVAMAEKRAAAWNTEHKN